MDSCARAGPAEGPYRAGTARWPRRWPRPPRESRSTASPRCAACGGSAFRSGSRTDSMVALAMEIPVFDHDSVLAAVSPLDAIERVRDGFVEHASGNWEMPPKLYLEIPPESD